MSGLVFGQAYVSVNGSQLATLPGAKLDLGGVERSPVAGSNRMLGFTEAPMPSMLTCEVALSEGMTLEELRRIKNATITFECDSGQTYSVREAYTTKPLNITSNDSGKVALEMAGMPAEEMAA